MTDRPIYLDYAAATPLDERVLSVMRPYFSEKFYNPSAPYAPARQVKSALNQAKEDIGRIIGGRASEIIFTAGATESINLAIRGVMAKYPEGTVLTTAIEHAAVLETAKQYKNVIITPQPTGMVSADDVQAGITDDTVLVSVGYVNNEIGTVQPISDIAHRLEDIRKQRRGKGNRNPLFFHSDASQAAGFFDLHISRLGVDLLTLNAAKCYGPKQTGLLWVKSGIVLEPVIYGGGQEFGLRGGTESAANIVGFAEALKIADVNRHAEVGRLSKLRDSMQKIILENLPDTIISGHPKRRAPNNLHVSWRGLDAERLLFALDLQGILVATGAACAANKGTGSHVCKAIGMDPQALDGSIRITLGRQTTEEEVNKASKTIIELVKKELRL